MPNRFEIVNGPEDAEDTDYMVCVRLTSPLILPDNEIDICAMCGEAIQHRPHAPSRPKKVCLECMAPQMNREAARGNLDVKITPRTAQEVADYLLKKSAN
jgi:hypothetical protein